MTDVRALGPPDIDYRAAAVGISDNGFAGASVGGQPWLVGNQRSSGEKMPNKRDPLIKVAEASSSASVSQRCSAKPRTVVMSVELMRIPVSLSMRVRSSRLPSESRPYSESGRSGSTVRRRIRPTCSETRRRSRAGHSSGGSSIQLTAEFACVRTVLPRGLEHLSEPAALREAQSTMVNRRPAHSRSSRGRGAAVRRTRRRPRRE